MRSAWGVCGWRDPDAIDETLCYDHLTSPQRRLALVPLGPHNHPPRTSLLRTSARSKPPSRLARARLAHALRNRRLEGALRVQVAHACPDRACHLGGRRRHLRARRGHRLRGREDGPRRNLCADPLTSPQATRACSNRTWTREYHLTPRQSTRSRGAGRAQVSSWMPMGGRFTPAALAQPAANPHARALAPARLDRPLDSRRGRRSARRPPPGAELFSGAFFGSRALAGRPHWQKNATFGRLRRQKADSNPPKHRL